MIAQKFVYFLFMYNTEDALINVKISTELPKSNIAKERKEICWC